MPHRRTAIVGFAVASLAAAACTTTYRSEGVGPADVQDQTPIPDRQSADGGTPTQPPVSTVPGPPRPSHADVGPRREAARTTINGSDIVPGERYTDVEVVGQVDIGADQRPTSFVNCRIDGSIVTSSPLVIEACEVTGGLFSYDVGGRISESLLRGRNVAFRPGTTSMADAFTTLTPWLVQNSIITVEQGVAPAHVEAAQVLGGAGIRFENVVFETGGPFNNTQTADLSVIGADMVCQDCWFLGYGGYSVYVDGPGNVLVRPRFGPHAEFGHVYPDADQPARIVEPIYLE